jgi:hypothetical protein
MAPKKIREGPFLKRRSPGIISAIIFYHCPRAHGFLSKGPLARSTNFFPLSLSLELLVVGDFVQGWDKPSERERVLVA